ncbi:Ribonuclease P protein subunit p25 [Quaeritorhiza haematococci]|nr:Ribonuclease P protein subunit p25 [Quaeritorhiza haematococci]
MDKYRRKTVIEQDPTTTFPDSIHISQNGNVKAYVSVVIDKLKGQHPGSTTPIKLFAKGTAINKAVTVAEIVKRRTGNSSTTSTSTSSQKTQSQPQSHDAYSIPLSQNTSIFSLKSIDVWEPVPGEQLDTLEVVRYLPGIQIELTPTPAPALTPTTVTTTTAV